MNKIIKIALFHLLAVTLCFSQNIDDYEILNEFIRNAKTISNADTIYLKPSNQNSFTIGIVEVEQFKEKNPESNDISSSEYSSIQIQRDNITNRILNDKEYENLIVQLTNSEWDFNNIIIPNVFRYANNRKKRGEEIISVGRPVYTLDKKSALVSFSYYTRSGIMVFRKINGQWQGNKIIAPLLIQPKAQVYQE